MAGSPDQCFGGHPVLFPPPRTMDHDRLWHSFYRPATAVDPAQALLCTDKNRVSTAERCDQRGHARRHSLGGPSFVAMNRSQKIILASGSPRRKQLLEWAEVEFEIVTRDTPETWPSGMPVPEVPVHIARNKALAVRQAVASAS